MAHHNWSDVVFGAVIGAWVVFLFMYYTMVAHIRKWRCGSDNPRKKGEL